MSPDLKDILVATIPSIIPSFMVGFGILINKNDTNRLSTEISGLRTEVRADMSSLRTDMGNLRTEMSAMKNQFHADVVTLINIGNDLDKRVTRMEDKD